MTRQQSVITGATGAGMLVLWLVLGHDASASTVIAGVAVALAVAAWASLAEF